MSGVVTVPRVKNEKLEALLASVIPGEIKTKKKSKTKIRLAKKAKTLDLKLSSDAKLMATILDRLEVPEDKLPLPHIRGSVFRYGSKTEEGPSRLSACALGQMIHVYDGISPKQKRDSHGRKINAMDLYSLLHKTTGINTSQIIDWNDCERLPMATICRRIRSRLKAKAAAEVK